MGKNTDANNKLKVIGDYVERGIEEMGNDEGLKIKATTIYSRNKARIPEFIMVFQYFAEYASINFKPATCKLLLALYSISEMKNYISIDVNTLCEKLKMSRQSIHNGLKELKNHNIIIILQNINDKRRNDYFMNPTTAWRGSGEQRNKVITKMKDRGTQLEFNM